MPDTMRQALLLFAFVFATTCCLDAQNQNISNGNFFEGEPFIAVNPLNPQHIAVAWMGFVAANWPRLSIKVRSSFDGGNTWKPIVTMPHIVASYKSADPSMAFDQNGALFLSYIDYQENPDEGGVYLYKSSDGGLTWGNPILMLDAFADGDKRPIDRPWLSINETGDKLYLTTTPVSVVLPHQVHAFGVEQRTNLIKIVFAYILDPCIDIDTGLAEYRRRARFAYTVNVGHPDLCPFIGR